MRKFAFAGLLLCTLASHLDVQAQPALSKDEKAAALAGIPAGWMGKVSNILLLAPDGKPLLNRIVSAYCSSSNGSNTFGGITTGAVGMMRVPDSLQPGRYNIYVHIEGIGAVAAPNVDINLNGAAAVKELRLQRGGGLQINVREADTSPERLGRPIGGASVSAQWIAPPDYPRDDPVTKILLGATSKISRDGDGAAAFADLLPGRYLLTSYSLGEFAPGAQEVEVKAGETLKVSLVLSRDVMTELKIAVRDEQGKPAANQEVTLSLRESPTSPMLHSSDSSMFSRTILTDAKGESMLYPVRTGVWQVTSLGKIRIKKAEVTVPREGATATLVVQKAK